MSILVRRCVNRSRAVEELVESWQVEHKAAMFACDVQELVSEWLELGTLVQYVWKTLLESLFDEKIDDIQTAGAMMQLGITKTLEVSNSLRTSIAAAGRKGFNIGKVSSFNNVVRELQQINEDFKKMWPTVNEQMVEESLAAYSRGEYQTIEEFGVAQGSSSCSNQ